MTPNEKAMIEALFSRIRTTAIAQRDGEAGQLIEAEMARTPGAAYALAQTVLVQDEALRHASEQIKTLEQAARQPQSAEASGSILSRVGLGGVRPGVAPRAGQPAEPDFSPPTQGGGGFLSGALQTAVGVAGGALLFEGVRSMFGGGSFLGGGGGTGPWGTAPATNETIINELSDSRGDDHSASHDRDDGDGVRDASLDPDDDDDDMSEDDSDWSDDGFDDDDTI